jgi:hypothetical protein
MSEMMTQVPEPGPLVDVPPVAGDLLETGGPLVACDPAEMARAQGNLIEWAIKMQHSLDLEAEELRKAHEVAVANKWGNRGILVSQLKRAEKRIVFYGKIESALRSGYLIVPNFEMSVFAIRTERSFPRGGWRQWGSDSSKYQQVSGILPAGEGDNVSPNPKLDHCATPYTDEQGKARVRHEYMPVEFEDVDFPMEVARPVVMETTARALKLRLFDEIGIAKDASAIRRGDPMILGRLRNPRPNRPDVTCFIAWYFDPRNV